MKHNFLLYSLLFFTFVSFGQNNSSSIILNDSVFNTDDKLMRFKMNVQKDWNFKFKDSRMLIFYKDSVWLLYFNAANISLSDTSESKFNDSTYLKQNGKRILPEMSFYFENKWSKKKKQDASKFNSNIYQQVVRLKKKYHLEHLQEWHKWGQSGFIGATSQEEGRIKEYLQEKENIEAQRIKIPYCGSSKYSIFIEYQNWVHALPNMISKFYPREKVASIDQMVEDLLQVHGGEDE